LSRMQNGRKTVWVLVMVAVIGIVCCPSLQGAAQDNTNAGLADTIVWNAKVYTVNANRPWAEAVAIRGATIVAVGSDKEMETYRGSSTQMIDAAGHLLLPGFEDCHIHFMDGSLGLDQVDRLANMKASATTAIRSIDAHRARGPLRTVGPISPSIERARGLTAPSAI